MALYLRLLDADADGAAWEEIAPIVLGLDPSEDPTSARHIFETHLARARWLSEQGYRSLLPPVALSGSEIFHKRKINDRLLLDCVEIFINTLTP